MSTKVTSDINTLISQINAIINAWRVPDKLNYAELVGALEMVKQDMIDEARERGTKEND